LISCSLDILIVLIEEEAVAFLVALVDVLIIVEVLVEEEAVMLDIVFLNYSVNVQDWRVVLGSCPLQGYYFHHLPLLLWGELRSLSFLLTRSHIENVEEFNIILFFKMMNFPAPQLAPNQYGLVNHVLAILLFLLVSNSNLPLVLTGRTVLLLFLYLIFIGLRLSTLFALSYMLTFL
jgi:hypothetical protein